MKLSCLMPRGVSALAVIVWVFSLSGGALAQFAPYGNSYQPQRGSGPNWWGPQYPQYQNVNYKSAPSSMAVPQRPPLYMAQPQYVAYAQQAPNLPPPPVATEPVPPGPMQGPSNGYMPPQPNGDYSQGGYENYSAGNSNNGNYNCGAGYSCDGYGNYNTPPAYGCCDVGYNCGPRRHWFGGVYGLLMQRETCGRIPLAFYTPTPPPGYYPTDDEIILHSADLEHDVQGGAEVRFGASFGCCGAGGYGGCCDPCGCSSGCGCGTLGWEVGYWALAEDSAYASFVDGAAGRTYSMKSYQGLEYNYGGVWRPVNHAYDYAPPTEDHYTAWANIDIRVNSIQVERNYDVQNVEWNLVCLPLAGGGCAPTCDPCGGGGCCDSCSGGGCCGGGCGQGHFGGGHGAYCYCGPRCQCSTSLGVRYFRFDEDFMYRADYSRWQMPGDTFIDSSYLAHYIEADNHLVGFQIGGNGCYHLGCCGRVALHISSNAGIYGNHMEVNQWMAGSQVRYANGDQDDFYINAEQDDIAFLGELRLGASYQCTCNCRVYGGYRALGVAGVALTTDQFTTAPYITPVQNSYINCDGALFIHGLQTGVEFMY